jgi:hypothetical protein
VLCMGDAPQCLHLNAHVVTNRSGWSGQAAAIDVLEPATALNAASRPDHGAACDLVAAEE